MLINLINEIFLSLIKFIRIIFLFYFYNYYTVLIASCVNVFVIIKCYLWNLKVVIMESTDQFRVLRIFYYDTMVYI